MELSEIIRDKIKQMIHEAKGSLNIPVEVEHKLTQIAYEMYKHGLRDGHRMCIKCLEVAKQNIDK